MNFFKTKQRTPTDLVRGLKDAIPKLESGAPGGETRRKVRSIHILHPYKMFTAMQASEEVSKNLQQIKAILYGDGGIFYFVLCLPTRS